MRRNVTHYNKWSKDGRRFETSILDHAAAMLCPSKVEFGDGTFKSFGPAKLVKTEWITEDIPVRTIDLSHIAPGASETITKTYDGMVFSLEGDELRLRMRAYAKHQGEDFKDNPEHPMTLPAGQMRLWVDATERKIAFNMLLDMVKGRPIPSKAPEASR